MQNTKGLAYLSNLLISFCNCFSSRSFLPLSGSRWSWINPYLIWREFLEISNVVPTLYNKRAKNS